jgi:hypothetical protein
MSVRLLRVRDRGPMFVAIAAYLSVQITERTLGRKEQLHALHDLPCR